MSATVPETVLDAPLEIQGNFPGLWWNTDRREARNGRVEELKEELPNADAVGIVDTDSDGLACEVVLNAKYENPVVIQANGGDYAISLSHALEIAGEHTPSDVPVIVADLSPDSAFSGMLAGLAKIESPVHVYDHHDWKWSAETSIRNVVEELVIGDDKCAAQVLQEEEYPEADSRLREFLDVTADHDLWRKEDERSDHLSTLAFQLDREEYVENALEYGANMVRESKELQGVYGESERQANERANMAIDRAEWHSINGVEVAVTYFDCHQSRVGDALLEQGADLAVIVQPTLSLSFRSTEEFGRCAELARGLQGGGHPTAAGAGLYHSIEMPETLSAEDLYIEEVDESVEDLNVDRMNAFDYAWRTGGVPCMEFVVEYLHEKI